jgi:Excalibur calcium-binding domain
MKTPALLTAALCALLFPARVEAYVECGNPPGPAVNVTATKVSCGDARSFARKVADRDVTESQRIALPGWRSYYATVRRVGGSYDVRATRTDKVIRFQYRPNGSSGGNCDPNYAGACLRPDVSDYDCEGGSGDGPYYTGLVEVVGDDHYALDRDGDGVACEPY